MEVLELLAPRCHISPICRELFHLLQKPHLQSLMCAHDAVAQKDFYPHLPEIPIEMDEDEDTIKIVQLVKSNEPLVSQFIKCLHQAINTHNYIINTKRQTNILFFNFIV